MHVEDPMKLGTLLGIGALAGAYYAHRRRGGELTADSVKDSLRALRGSVEEAVGNLKTRSSQLSTAPSARAYDAELVEPTGGPTVGRR
jgi:hypothetical protein